MTKKKLTPAQNVKKLQKDIEILEKRIASLKSAWFHSNDFDEIDDIKEDMRKLEEKKEKREEKLAELIEDILLTAHDKEAKRKKARFGNFGWAQTEWGIASKTSKGILDSEMDPDTLKVTHAWG